MNVEIGFLPDKYISPIPDAGGHFPFSIDGEASYFVDISCSEESAEEFIAVWMSSLSRYPMYIFFEGFDFSQKEVEQDCSNHNIEFEIFPQKNRDFYIKAVIRSDVQFKILFPHLFGNGSMNNFAAWSLDKDVFTLGKRKFNTLFGVRDVVTPIVTLSENTTIFWIGYDGDNVVGISNEENFGNLSSISNTFPNGISFSVVEFGE